MDIKEIFKNMHVETMAFINCALAKLMEENRQELAVLDTVETSRAYKNYYEDSIPKAIQAVRYFAEAVDKIYDCAVPPREHAFATVTRCPLGVVGIITPWNDPMVVAAWKFAPALLMGNSVHDKNSHACIRGRDSKRGVPSPSRLWGTDRKGTGTS